MFHGFNSDFSRVKVIKVNDEIYRMPYKFWILINHRGRETKKKIGTVNQLFIKLLQFV